MIFLNNTNAAFVLLACYYFYVAKEVMFYVEFVYSSVCMFATSRKSYWSDENFSKDVTLDKEDVNKF